MQFGRFKVQLIPFREQPEKTFEAWVSLEERSLEGNAYLSSNFVRPALRWLSGPRKDNDALILLVTKIGVGHSDLVGVGVFLKSTFASKFPFSNLQAYRSVHSYISGFMIDREEAQEVVEAIFNFLCRTDVPWNGVFFDHILVEGAQAELIASVAQEVGAIWYESERYKRAVLNPSENGYGYLEKHLATRKIKEMKRLRRRLSDLGEVGWRVLHGEEIDKTCIQRFLELENKGWKGKNGKSLKSRPSHDDFFEEMIARFNYTQKVFFTELLVDGKVIASTANLISGNAGFAFKIGWDAEYARFAPGLQNELEFIINSPEFCRRLTYIDSGAEEGSFIEQLWCDRRTIVSGIYSTTPIGNKLLSGVQVMRGLKRTCTSFVRSMQERGPLKN